MGELWRHACARCGSRAVVKNPGGPTHDKGGWHCNACGKHSPVVFDLKESIWVRDSKVKGE